VIDSRECAEAFRQLVNFDHRLTHLFNWVDRSILRVLRAHSSLFNSFYIWKINISSHSGAQTVVIAGQTDLYAEHLSDPVGDRLHVARGELGLTIYLLDDAIEIFARKRIDPDADVLAQFNQTQPRFRT
jgi:hypothetical protein